MEVKIVGIEVVKPFSPTIKTFNLSFIDQQLPFSIYVKVFLFYRNTSGVVTEDTISERTRHLKSSLSKVLTHYYPLAGKMKDTYSVCTGEDDGAEFVEARVKGSLSEYLVEPNINLFRLHLVPEDYRESWVRPLLIIQASFFTCGGLAIGINISHRVADIATITSFVNAWANTATATFNNAMEPDFSGSLIFPPSDKFSFIKAMDNNQMPGPIPVTRRFVFSASHIVALQQKTTKQGIRSPSRVQAISAFLWRIAVKLSIIKGGGFLIPSTLIMPINLRRLIPSLIYDQSFGNLIEYITVHNHNGETEILNLVNLLKEKIDELRKRYEEKIVDGERCFTRYLGTTSNSVESAVKKVVPGNHVVVSSWSRFPLYDADFGWGRPTWVTNGCRGPNLFLLIDTSDGTGIEALVSLVEEDMVVFANDEELLAYSTLDPSVLS